MLYNCCMKYYGQTLDQLLVDYGAEEVPALAVYSDIFRLGYGFIQRTGEQAQVSPVRKANPIILGSFDGVIRRRIMLEDTFTAQLEEFQQADWAILNGITYFGKANSANNQSQLCALIFDLDGITPVLFNNFLHAAHVDLFNGHGAYPIPNYVIMSGTNVHLYYLLDDPIPLFPQAKQQLKKLKYALTRQIWNRYTSDIKNPQYQGINQGFRVIGGKTKHEGVRVRAFLLNKHPFCIDELNDYVPADDQANVYEPNEYRLTLEQAKEMYPDWYQRIVVNKESRKIWTVKEDLYYWWLRKLQALDGVTFGHRYFCVMALAIFAAKCGILDKDKVKADAMALIPSFSSLNIDDPFTEKDVDSALDCLDLRYCTFPRNDLEKITAIAMPPNKRNGRKQLEHLARIRVLQEYDDKINGTNWRDGNGRPKGSLNKTYPKKDLIVRYKQEHPKATQREIAKAVGVSPTTVNKWLKQK